MLSELPEGLVKYSTSPLFTEETLPQALQNNHKTKKGIWAKAVVIEGAIRYVLEETLDPPITLHADEFVIIEPQVPHHVEIIGSVVFCLEFYR